MAGGRSASLALAVEPPTVHFPALLIPVLGRANGSTRASRQRGKGLFQQLRYSGEWGNDTAQGDRPAGNRHLPHRSTRLRPATALGPRFRRDERAVRRSQRSGRRLALPGPHHRAVGHRGNRQHRRRCMGHPLGRAWRALLDVDDCTPGDGDEVLRGHLGPALSQRGETGGWP